MCICVHTFVLLPQIILPKFVHSAQLFVCVYVIVCELENGKIVSKNNISNLKDSIEIGQPNGSKGRIQRIEEGRSCKTKNHRMTHLRTILEFQTLQNRNVCTHQNSMCSKMYTQFCFFVRFCFCCFLNVVVGWLVGLTVNEKSFNFATIDFDFRPL